jgi:cytochrome c-L
MLCLGLLAGAAPAQGTEPERTAEDVILFRHVLDDEPIAFTYRADQEITPAVEAFHQTAENPYVGDPAAIEAGHQLYAKLCQACHLPDGTGRIGPNLVDERWRRPRTDTDIGRFEIIYAGGAGAMQSFGRHIDQDQILRVMAYLKVLRESPSD